MYDLSITQLIYLFKLINSFNYSQVNSFILLISNRSVSACATERIYKIATIT